MFGKVRDKLSNSFNYFGWIFDLEFVSLPLKFFLLKIDELVSFEIDRSLNREWFLLTSIKSSIWLSIKILGKLGIGCRFIKSFENFENIREQWIGVSNEICIGGILSC